MINVGPKSSIVSFNSIPKLYCKTSLSTFFRIVELIPEIRILMAAEANAKNTFRKKPTLVAVQQIFAASAVSYWHLRKLILTSQKMFARFYHHNNICLQQISCSKTKIISHLLYRDKHNTKMRVGNMSKLITEEGS